MRQLGEIYAINHLVPFKECTKVDNITMYVALTLKLRKMLGHGDTDAGKEREAAELFYHQMARHCPNATWQNIVDACEDRIINENRPNVTPVNVVKWAKNHYDCLPKKTPRHEDKRISAPVDAPEEFYHERYMCALAQWAHGQQVWDVNSFAYEYLIRTGKITEDVPTKDIERVKELAEQYVAREASKVQRGKAPFIWGLHSANNKTHMAAAKHARLLLYFEQTQDASVTRTMLEKPKTLLGYV